MKTKAIWFQPIFFILLSSLFLTACSSPPPQPIKLGLAINLSGRGGMAGEEIRDGALLATRQINEQGGIKGRPLELIIKDDKNSDQGIKEADQALIDAGVLAIIGHSYSSNTVKAHPLVTSQDTLLITAYTATTKLSQQDDLFLRTSVDCHLYGQKLAALLSNEKLSNISVLMDMSNSAFVLDYLHYIEKYYQGTINRVELESRQDADWPSLIQQLLDPEPQAIIMLTEATMTAVALQKLYDKRFSGPRFGTVWTQTPSLLKFAGVAAAEDFRIITFLDPQNTLPAYQQFAQDMEEAFHKPATPRSSRGYELVSILAQALRQCHEFTAQELKAKLLAGQFTTLLGQVAFDQFGDVKRPVYQVTIKDGVFQTIGEIN